MKTVGRVVLAAAVVVVVLSALSSLSGTRETPRGCVGVGCATPAVVHPLPSQVAESPGPIKKVDCGKWQWHGRDGVLKYGDTCWVTLSP